MASGCSRKRSQNDVSATPPLNRRRARRLSRRYTDARDRPRSVATWVGSQPFHGRTVILIDEFSHSAAEMVAAFAKDNQLAVLAGNRTAGEVLGGANFRVGNGYYLRMPITGWYTWQGKCIEGTGVSPDVAVDVDLAALARGED